VRGQEGGQVRGQEGRTGERAGERAVRIVLEASGEGTGEEGNHLIKVAVLGSLVDGLVVLVDEDNHSLLVVAVEKSSQDFESRLVVGRGILVEDGLELKTFVLFKKVVGLEEVEMLMVDLRNLARKIDFHLLPGTSITLSKAHRDDRVLATVRGDKLRLLTGELGLGKERFGELGSSDVKEVLGHADRGRLGPATRAQDQHRLAMRRVKNIKSKEPCHHRRTL